MKLTRCDNNKRLPLRLHRVFLKNYYGSASQRKKRLLIAEFCLHVFFRICGTLLNSQSCRLSVLISVAVLSIIRNIWIFMLLIIFLFSSA